MEFSEPIVAGDTLIRAAIQSENYVADTSGWRISRNGDAEFNDLEARGTITASELDIDNQPQGRLHAYFDDGDTNVHVMEMYIGNENIADVWGSGITEDLAALIRPGISTVNPQPFLRFHTSNLTDGSGDGGFASMELQGRSPDGSDGPLLFVSNAGASTPRGRFILDDNWDVLTPSMRHATVSTSTDIMETATSFTETDTLMRITTTYPASGIVSIGIGFQGSNNGVNNRNLMSVEIRDDDISGTVRYSPSVIDCALMKAYVASQADFTFWQLTLTGLPTSGTMFVRAMYRVTAGTGTWNDRRLNLIPSP